MSGRLVCNMCEDLEWCSTHGTSSPIGVKWADLEAHYYPVPLALRDCKLRVSSDNVKDTVTVALKVLYGAKYYSGQHTLYSPVTQSMYVYAVHTLILQLEQILLGYPSQGKVEAPVKTPPAVRTTHPKLGVCFVGECPGLGKLWFNPKTFEIAYDQRGNVYICAIRDVQGWLVLGRIVTPEASLWFESCYQQRDYDEPERVLPCRPNAPWRFS